MFEACEAFVWCPKDHFYAIYSHLKKKKKKKVQKFQSGIFGLFLTAMAFRLLDIVGTNILRHPSPKKPKKYQKHVKIIFQTPNKGLTCFKHSKFLMKTATPKIVFHIPSN